MSTLARFTGRVRLSSGASAYGCRAQLRVGGSGPAGGTVVAETWTSTRGEFTLVVPPGRMAVGDPESARLLLEVTDGTGAVLAAEEVVARPGQSVHVPLTGTRKTGVTLPVALPLVRAPNAPLVRPEALAVIDAALAMLAPQGSPAWEPYARAARRSLPPAGHVEELLELAWAALDGDPRAVNDLREVLAVQAATSRKDAPMPSFAPAPEDDDRRRPKVAYGVARDAAPKGPPIEPVTTTGRLLSVRAAPAEEADDRRRDDVETAVPTERLVPLLVATVRIARNSGERVAFFDALHGVLSGLSTVDRLHRAALDVLQHRRIAPLRALLALLLADIADASDLPIPMPGTSSSPGADPLLPTLVDPWWERLQGAVRDTLNAQKTRHETAYRITDVEPAHALPGEAVRILGEGFGTGGGQVAFDGASAVEPLSWTDTEVRVVVPEGARPGLLSLRILDGVVRVRRRMVEFYREGAGFPFEGGRPLVRSVLVDGRGEGAWVRPGDPVAVSWTTVSGRQARVSLHARARPSVAGADASHDVVLFDEDDLPASGSRILAVPEVDAEHVLLVHVEVRTGAGAAAREASFPVAVPPKLRVEGMEVTQGLQRAPWDPAPALPTVAGRDTLVRVYVSADRDGFQDDRTRIVHARLRVGDHVLPAWPVGEQVAHGFVAGRASAIDRARAEDALLFRIPAALCQGTRELHVEVSAEGSPPTTPSAEARVTWTWWPARALPVRVVRLARPDQPAPGAAEALATAVRALDLLPTAADDVGPAWLDVVTSDATPEGVIDGLAEARDPAAWEWLAHEVTGLPRDEADALWLVVGAEAPRPVVDVHRRVALAGVVPEPAHDPGRRTAAAGVLARLADPGFDAEAEGARRIVDVPFDPHVLDTVVDRNHGVRDVGGRSPTDAGAAWTSPARWRRLVERG